MFVLINLFATKFWSARSRLYRSRAPSSAPRRRLQQCNFTRRVAKPSTASRLPAGAIRTNRLPRYLRYAAVAAQNVFAKNKINVVLSAERSVFRRMKIENSGTYSETGKKRKQSMICPYSKLHHAASLVYQHANLFSHVSFFS